MEMVKQDNRRELSARVFLEYILSRTTSVILHGVTFRFTEILTVVSVSSRPVLYLMIHSSDLMEKRGRENVAIFNYRIYVGQLVPFPRCYVFLLPI